MALDTIGSNVNIDSCYSILKEIFDLQLQQNNETLIGMSLPIASIIVPTAMTLLVFGIGLLLDKIIKQKRKKNEIISLKETFNVFINEAKTNVNAQIESIRKLTEILQKSSDFVPPPMDFYIIGLDRLKEFNLKELVQSFVINQKGDQEESKKILFSVVQELAYLSKVTDIIKDNYTEYRKLAIDLKNEWETKKEIFGETYNKFLLDFMGTYGTLLKDCLSIFHGFNQDTSSPEEWVEKIYKPLHKKMDSYFEEKIQYEVVNMKNTIYKLIDLYERKKVLFLANKIWFDDYANNLNHSYTELCSNYEKLYNYKIVKFFKIK